MTLADLRPLFDPTSVAIVGASDDPAKWGYALSRQALRAGSRRRIHLVNRGGGEILGRPSATSLRGIGEPVELVVVCVPAGAFEATVDDALAVGARAIVAITAGFAELGAAGAARQRAVADRVRAAGARLLGPNCLGLADNTTELYLTSDPFPPGGVALLSQSGNLALELRLRISSHGLGFSRFVSFGNQADVTLVDLVVDCAGNTGTTAIAVYVEDFGDGRAFAAAAAEAGREGKPVVLLSAGTSEAATRGARSHTGALTTAAELVAAAAGGAGIHQARTPRELVTMLAALCRPRRAAGRRTTVVSDGGGHGLVAADAAERVGLSVTPTPAPLRRELRDLLWANSSVANPIDLAGMGEQDPMTYARTVGALLADHDVDAVLMTGYFGGYAASDESFGGPALFAGERAAAAEIARLVTAGTKPVVVHSMYPASPSCRLLADAGVPVFGGIEDAALALAAVSGEAPSAAGPAPLPSPAPAVTDAGYFGCRRLLAAAGVRFPPAIEVSTLDDLRAAAAALPGPYVLKALHLVHKSDAGGVVLDLADEPALACAYRDLRARLGASVYSVEAQAPPGLDLIVGVRWDARFGPVVMVGLGGVHAEVLRDIAFALAPVTAAEAVGLLRGLRAAALLDGVRGAPRADVTALADAVAAVSAVAAAHPEIAELEVNPLRVTPHGAWGLDARAVLAIG